MNLGKTFGTGFSLTYLLPPNPLPLPQVIRLTMQDPLCKRTKNASDVLFALHAARMRSGAAQSTPYLGCHGNRQVSCRGLSLCVHAGWGFPLSRLSWVCQVKGEVYMHMARFVCRSTEVGRCIVCAYKYVPHRYVFRWCEGS